MTWLSKPILAGRTGTSLACTSTGLKPASVATARTLPGCRSCVPTNLLSITFSINNPRIYGGRGSRDSMCKCRAIFHFVPLPVCLSIDLPVYLWKIAYLVSLHLTQATTTRLSTNICDLSIYLSVYQTVCLSVCLPASLPPCLSVCLYALPSFN